MVGKELKELRNTPLAGQIALHHIERGGVTIPMGLNTKLERFDVLFVGGVRRRSTGRRRCSARSRARALPPTCSRSRSA